MAPVLKIVKQTFKEFSADNCPQMAAALSYYTIFSLPPLLVLVVMTAGLFLDPGEVLQWIRDFIGSEDAANQVQTMVSSASQELAGGFSLTLILSIAGLLFSATGAFAQFQKALNTAWEVGPDPDRKGAGKILHFAMKRLLSLGMIIVIGFLLVVALTVSGLISTFAEFIKGYLVSVGVPETLAGLLTYGVDPVIFLLLLWALFGGIFMFLPDARVRWRDVSVGALVTAILFVLGKLAVGLYIGQSNPGSAFGAAGALAIILVFVYYAAMIVLLGAEFTQVWARRRGERIVPARHAVRIAAVRPIPVDESPDGKVDDHRVTAPASTDDPGRRESAVDPGQGGR